jgi:hypothetical protein
MRVRLGVAVLVLGLACCWLAGGVWAAEAKKGDATGNWKSTFKAPNGNTIETTYKLKQDGTKLTGTVKGRDGKEVKIEKGKVEDGKVSFQVTREFNDRKFTIKYHGKLEGDGIKGKMEFPGRDGGEGRSFDWEAKRQK